MLIDGELVGRLTGLKALFVVKDLSELHTRTWREAQSLHEAGAKVAILTNTIQTPTLFKDIDFEVLNPNLTTTHSSHPVWAIRCFQNLTYYRWKQHQTKKPDYNFVQTGVLFNPDIIHVHNPYSIPGAFRIAERSNAQIIYETAEYFQGLARASCFNETRIAALKRYAFDESKYIHRVDATITVSEAISEMMQKDYGEFRNIVVCNASIAQSQKTAVPAHSPIRIVFHGTIYRDRNIDGLIKAFALLEKGVCTLDIWGMHDDATYELELEALIHELELSDTIFLRGKFEHDSIVDILKTYDVGIYPSIAIEENFQYSLPNKVFDHITAGVALVMPDFISLRRIVETEGNGIIADTTNPESLAAQLVALLADPERIYRMKKASVNCAEKYSWKSQSEKLIDLYSALRSNA